MHNPPYPGEVFRELNQAPLGLSAADTGQALKQEQPDYDRHTQRARRNQPGNSDLLTHCL